LHGYTNIIIMNKRVLPVNQCVYVIYNKEYDITKIGISQNPETRLIELETGAGCELVIKHQTMPLMNARQIEKLCHKHFKPHHKRGEWFYIDPARVIEYIKTLTLHYDEITNMYMNNKTITEIADKYDVTRQAIIKRLKEYGIHKEHKPIKLPEHKESIIDITNYSRVDKNIYKDEQGNTIQIQYKNGAFYKIAEVVN